MRRPEYHLFGRGLLFGGRCYVCVGMEHEILLLRIPQHGVALDRRRGLEKRLALSTVLPVTREGCECCLWHPKKIIA